MTGQSGDDAEAKAGACVVPAVLVNENDVVKAPRLATTVKEPTVALAAIGGAVAIPAALLAAVTIAPVPRKDPEAPFEGAVNVIDSPGSGWPRSSLITAANGIA